MRITTNEITKERNLKGMLILEALGKHPELIEQAKINGGVDIKLFINDNEVEFSEVIDHWQKNVNKAIETKARELMEEHPLFQQLNELQEKLTQTINEITLKDTR